MDEFLVGSIISSEPYGGRRLPDPIARKRQSRSRDDASRQGEGPVDTFEFQETGDDCEVSCGLNQDYYLPSDPSSESE